MPFAPGEPRPAGSGRQPGQVNKATLLARDGLKNAVAICRRGGKDPLEILMENARFLSNVAVALAEGATSAEAVRTMASTNEGRADLNFIRKFMVDSSAIAYKAAEFCHAKLSRIDMQVGGDPDNPLRLELTEAERFTSKIAQLAARGGAGIISGEPVGEGARTTDVPLAVLGEAKPTPASD